MSHSFHTLLYSPWAYILMQSQLNVKNKQLFRKTALGPIWYVILEETALGPNNTSNYRSL